MSTLAERGLKPASELAATRAHGDRLRYIGGCRCAECRRANTDYEKARALARKAGDWNGIVPAAKARQHMLKLSRQGVGRRAVQAATDIGDTVLQQIRSGDKKNIRARTERLILAVTKEMASDHALIPAAPSLKLIDELLSKGYTKTQLARMLNYKNHALQFNFDQITAANAFLIRKLYDRCKAINFTDASNFVPAVKLPTNTYSPRPGVLVHQLPG